jgi:hypothetical protein
MEQTEYSFQEIEITQKPRVVYMPRGKERYAPIFSTGDQEIGIVFFEKPFFGLRISIKTADLKVQGQTLNFKFDVQDVPNGVTQEDLNSKAFSELVNFSLNDLFERIGAWEQEKDKQ